jgi:hypothetical protein
MDIFIDYGLKVTKEIIILLLNNKCYINNIEKYNIEIDEDILIICSEKSYYPYKFTIKPQLSVLLKECSRHDNLLILKTLKESGGEFNSQCLECACKISNNSKVIKFLLKDCKVKADINCIKAFEETYNMQSLSLLIQSFKGIDIDNVDKTDIDINNDNIKSNDIINTNIKNIIEIKKENSIELNIDSIMSIIPCENVEIDEEREYKLKNKIKKLLDCKKNNLKIIDLFELFLKYLIKNKLIIGNYLVINKELSELLKLNYCTIISIDEVQNMLTYFID